MTPTAYVNQGSVTDKAAPIERKSPPGRPSPWVLWPLVWGIIFVAYYALHGERISPDQANESKSFLLTGDEPHYLLVAHSIAMDGDIDLGNNLANEDRRSFSDNCASS